jgi:hypothetical protein
VVLLGVGTRGNAPSAGAQAELLQGIVPSPRSRDPRSEARARDLRSEAKCLWHGGLRLRV